MLIDELKKANIEAMKNRDSDARAALSVVLTKYKLQEVEACSQGKEIGDSELLSIIQKVIKELSDEKEGYVKVNNTERIASISKQEETLKAYLPRQLSEEEIRAEINKLEDKSMPSIMKHFKAHGLLVRKRDLPRRRLAHSADLGHGKSRNDGDDRDDHQKLYERKCPFHLFAFPPFVLLNADDSHKVLSPT